MSEEERSARSAKVAAVLRRAGGEDIRAGYRSARCRIRDEVDLPALRAKLSEVVGQAVEVNVRGSTYSVKLPKMPAPSIPESHAPAGPSTEDWEG